MTVSRSGPLLDIMTGKKARTRRAPKVQPIESVLHFQVAGLLRHQIAAGWIWGHYPAGEHRDIRTAAKLKQMGVQRGWPDILLVNQRGVLHALELKRIGGSLTEDQRNFQTWAVGAGVPFAVARTLDEVLVIFDRWGCLRIKISGGAA